MGLGCGLQKRLGVADVNQAVVIGVAGLAAEVTMAYADRNVNFLIAGIAETAP